MSESKTVQNNCVVGMHYTLRDSEGDIIDSSPDGEALLYLHGHENIVPGLEQALTGMAVGESKSVVVLPEDGYGLHEEDMVLSVPLSQFPPEMEPEVGMSVEMESDEGETVPVRIAEVSETHVKLDANHELAGVTLYFEVTIDSVREATQQELTHGHVHGPGGHHHH